MLCFSFRVPPPTESSPLSLHDALPIYSLGRVRSILPWPLGLDRQRPPLSVAAAPIAARYLGQAFRAVVGLDRKSTRLNSSHRCISYAVFCLKKKTDHRLVLDYRDIRAV